MIKRTIKNSIFVITIIAFICMITSNVSASVSNKEMKKTIYFLDNKIELNYSKMNRTFDNKEILIYEDNNLNQYFYKNNKLVAYIRNEYFDEQKELLLDKNVDDYDKNAKQKVLSENIEHAEKYLSYFVENKDNQLFSYELVDATYLADTGEYSYIYTKKIDGYLVNDGIVLSLDEDGKLISYSGAHQGMYDNYSKIHIDSDEVNKFVINEMNNIGIDNYRIDKQFINFVDNQLVLQIGIEISHKDGGYSTTVIYYEL